MDDHPPIAIHPSLDPDAFAFRTSSIIFNGLVGSLKVIQGEIPQFAITIQL
jgi:hypothetical protein